MKMAQWLKFEKDSTEYLNAKFGAHARFFHSGGEDSTASDIRVTTVTGKNFCIEAKLTPAQCGQFVLIPNVSKKCFEFSNKNKTIITPQVQAIIDCMNANFEAYKEAGTAGKAIDLNDAGETFCKWIIETYRNKGTEFFITNEYTILPISDFAKHFNVTATYRVKRSGSSSVGKRKISCIIEKIKSDGYPVDKFLTQDEKLFIFSSKTLHDARFICDGFEYMFSLRDDKYEIRKLSNTFNANVIFSIFKKDQKGLSESEFRAALI